MRGKVISFPARPTVVDENNILWLIAVGRRSQDEYTCKYSNNGHYWSCEVKSNTFAGAMALVEQCRHTLGLELSVNGEGVAKHG